MAGYFEQYKKSEVTETNRIIHTPSSLAKKTFLYPGGRISEKPETPFGKAVRA
ncbi:MAG: hypothetical protein ACLTBV_09095 [Enterocloster bolteae]